MYKIKYDNVQSFAEETVHMFQNAQGKNEVDVLISGEGIKIIAHDFVDENKTATLFIEQE